MNIGIYVSSLTPNSAAQARFQGALFAGLHTVSACRYRFIVLSHEVPETYRDSENFRYVTIVRESSLAKRALFIKAQLGRYCVLFVRYSAQEGRRFDVTFSRWMCPDPKYYQQLRELNVRLLWNMNQHELPTCLPFIRTVWEANHRIHPMFPEYSYARLLLTGWIEICLIRWLEHHTWSWAPRRASDRSLACSEYMTGRFG